MLGNIFRVVPFEIIEMNPCVKEAILYQRADNGIVCGICERRCVISQNELGFCKTRKNIAGKIYTLEYGYISSLSVNPIEKKPFFHFYPGSLALTAGSWGCNFACPWCQNYDISKSPPKPEKCCYVSPQTFITLMKEDKCQGTSFSFNEPTLLLEYSLDVFDLSKKEGYYNTYVTNGYMTKGALRLLIEHGLDAANFDMKGDKEAVQKYCGAEVEKVWQNIDEAKKSGVHVEITTLIIPDVNDDEGCLRGIARNIYSRVGDTTPWHVTRYYPAYNAAKIGLTGKPTTVNTLEKAWQIGREEGLSYVYVGNVLGHKRENTHCPRCGLLLIKRYGFDIIKEKILRNNKCPCCGEIIPITGKKV